MGLLIRRAALDDMVVDVRMDRGIISAVVTKLSSGAGDEEIDALGGAVIPGLHDHHIHLRAWAAAKQSVVVGPPAVNDFKDFEKALKNAASTEAGWIRAVGYHESVAGELDRRLIDSVVRDRPVRVQHRSGILWILNTAALNRVGAEGDSSPGIERGPDGAPTGRLRRMDDWLAHRLRLAGGADYGLAVSADSGKQALAALSRDAAARGVTGWTDATPGRDAEEARALVDAVATGSVRQRLHLMLPLGAGLPRGGPSSGPVKVMLDDTELPPLAELARIVSTAHGNRRAAAVHCVTRSQLAFALAAFDDATTGSGGSHGVPNEGDRIEHGADIPHGYVPLLAQRGLTVVTQPSFVYERGDQYLDEVDPEELPDLWRVRSLITSGVQLAAGSDAPFGSADPWVGVRASMRRVSRSGTPIVPDESVDWRTALDLWLGRATRPTVRRAIAVGEPADVALLELPLPMALEGDGPVSIRATVISGQVAFHA